MNGEATDFAAQRFAPRTSASAARLAYAGEHYRPEPHGNGNIRGYLMAAFIGAAIALCIVYSF